MFRYAWGVKVIAARSYCHHQIVVVKFSGLTIDAAQVQDLAAAVQPGHGGLDITVAAADRMLKIADRIQLIIEGAGSDLMEPGFPVMVGGRLYQDHFMVPTALQLTAQSGDQLKTGGPAADNYDF
ncbi:hypothetical protein GCM10022228_06860 [Halomonas cibimaris]|uniref:Uncharacterized protein n=1 Tax=Halomonas cibimaris TaxID=657012 RepID=A0ABP7LG52_9GAMM